MSEPLAFVSNLFGYKLAEFSVAVMDPFTRVNTWLDENKGLGQEVVIFSKWTMRLINKYLCL